MSERITSKTIYSASPGEKSHMDTIRAYAERQAKKKESSPEPESSGPGVALEPRPDYDPVSAETGYESVDGEAVAEEDPSSPESDDDIADAEVVDEARTRVLEELRRQEEQQQRDREAEQLRIEEENNKIQDAIDIRYQINAADRISDRHHRTPALVKLGEKYNGVIDPRNGVDLGVEAISRLRRSKTRRRFNPRNIYLRRTNEHDAALRDMARAENNLQAAQKIVGNRLRNKILLEIAKKDESQGGRRAGMKVTKNMEGWGKRKYQAEEIAHIAIKRRDPALLDSINGILNWRIRDKALVDIAAAVYSRDGSDEAEKVIKKIRNPDYKSHARKKIAQIKS